MRDAYGVRMSERAELLKRVNIFVDLDEGDILDLANSSIEKKFSKNNVIVSQEEQGSALYILCEGRVKVVLYGDSGKELILTVFKPGDFFGEMSLLDKKPRSAHVICMEDSKLIILERNIFEKQILKNPKVALKILQVLSARLRKTDESFGNLALLDVYGRLARTLIDMGNTDGKKVSEGLLIENRPTHQEIAAMIGATRETVSRGLSEFERRGFIIFPNTKSMIIITDSRISDYGY